MQSSKVKANNRKKIWMAAALVFVILAAVFLRAFLVYRIYPLDYKQIIEQRSKEYALDPYLVSAIIYTESRFKPDAVSPKGATGLMQIMPDTGEWISGKIGIEDYTHSMLLNPDINIRLGCWYIRYLFDKFSGNMDKVLAAYNAGPRNVDNWSSDGALEYIPFPETQNYLKTVERNHYIYKGLYNVFEP